MADDTKTTESSGWVWWLLVTITYALIGFVFSAGAAKLSYDRSNSILYAILSFIMSPLYYPYYAFTQPAQTVMGAGRKLKGLW